MSVMTLAVTTFPTMTHTLYIKSLNIGFQCVSVVLLINNAISLSICACYESYCVNCSVLLLMIPL